MDRGIERSSAGLAVHALISGAGGFVGSAAAAAFLRAGWQVTGLCRKRRPAGLATGPGLVLIDGNLEDALLPESYDVLVHCAAEVPAHCADEALLYRNNVEGTRRLLAHAIRARAKRVIYMSSMAVYGKIGVPLIEEQSPIEPSDPYAKSKAEGEVQAAGWARDTARGAVSIRLPGVVGAGGRNNFLCDSLLRMLSGQSIAARNPGALFNNVVHVVDLATFVVTLASGSPKGHTVLTVGAEQPLSIGEVLSRMYRRAGKPERIDWTAGGRPPFLISFEHARALGYRPATVADSVDRFVSDSIAAGVTA